MVGTHSLEQSRLTHDDDDDDNDEDEDDHKHVCGGHAFLGAIKVIMLMITMMMMTIDDDFSS